MIKEQSIVKIIGRSSRLNPYINNVNCLALVTEMGEGCAQLEGFFYDDPDPQFSRPIKAYGAMELDCLMELDKRELTQEQLFALHECIDYEVSD